jgi:flagellar hook-associated protein 2
MSLKLSGLASGFDWQSLVDQLMEVERVPINRLEVEQTRNSQKVTQLGTLGSRLSALQAAAAALHGDSLFDKRSVSNAVAPGGWSASAGAGVPTGSYAFNVTQLATTARRDGVGDRGGALATTADVSGLTVASLPIANPVTAGTFSVNGKQITVSLTDSLADVFTAIETATGGAVTARYDETADGVVLESAGEIILGAANDTSNFLRSLKLGNNGTGTVTSSGTLGTVRTGMPLASANLGTAITAVDVDGNGAFTINGVEVAYNVNTDSLATVMKRINQSGAGVTASYDASLDRMVIANNTTGDLGIAFEENAGGFLGAMGFATGGSFVRGQNAEFTLNNGGTLTSASNTLDGSAHGIAGLSITATAEGEQTITVSPDTEAMRTKIDEFIKAFNEVQTFLETSTRVSTDSKGKVTAALLSDNREIQSWGRELRSKAFNAVPGLAGTISRLESLGIDFRSGTNELEVKDGAKLDAALRDRPSDVGEFFTTSGDGLARRIEDYVKGLDTLNKDQQSRLNKANTSIDEQIVAIERRLEQQRALMESAFIAMETAQSQLQSQAAALNNAFGAGTTAKQ